MGEHEVDVETQRRAATLAPLVRLGLNVQLVVLLLVSVSLDTTASLVVVVLMAATAAGPLLLWRRVGPGMLLHPAAVLPALVLAVGAGLLQTVPAGLRVAYAAAVAFQVALLYGRVAGLGLIALPALAFLLPTDGLPLLARVVDASVVVVAAVAGARLRVLLLALDRARTEASRAAAVAATADERTRLARELHDSVAKTLQGVELTATALARAADDPARARSLAEQVADGCRRVRVESRSLLHGLRADQPTLSPRASLAELLVTFSRLNDLEVEADLSGLDGLELTFDVRHELFQIVREALRNVAAHAGATRVHVTARREGDRLVLTVDDDGVGIPADAGAGRYGLVGMRERGAQLGGVVDVRPRTDAGTRVEVSIPTGAAA